LERRDFLLRTLGTLPVLACAPEVEALVTPPVDIAWRRYSICPTTESALVAVAALVRLPHGERLSSQIHNEVDSSLSSLESAVSAGHAESILLAAHLRSRLAFGSVAGSMNYILGQGIRSNPEAFLEALAKRPELRGNSKILLNLGLDFVDRFDEQIVEIQGRINALGQANDPELRAVRDEAIALLHEGLERRSRMASTPRAGTA